MITCERCGESFQAKPNKDGSFNGFGLQKDDGTFVNVCARCFNILMGMQLKQIKEFVEGADQGICRRSRSMIRKVLGKIESVSFGFIPDREFLFGLSLTFRFESGGVQGNDTINIGKECKWTTAERQEAITAMIDRVAEVMRKAKVTDVTDLEGKPVEVTLEDDWYKSFRILTEVL